MSPRNDNYLSLCLTEATNSPLHYRHGAIVVRGGKVIGQGHNDYRSGFDGGALKSGSQVSSAHAGSKSKVKRNSASPPAPHYNRLANADGSAFHPFEATSGGGHLSNTPLTMHSEMMAIQSALAATSQTTSSSMTFALEKPCYKLSGDSKRKQRLRRECLAKYVETVCRAALGEHDETNTQSEEWRFEGGASGHSDSVRRAEGTVRVSERGREHSGEADEEEGGKGGRVQSRTTLASSQGWSVQPRIGTARDAESAQHTSKRRTTRTTSRFWIDAAPEAMAAAAAAAAA